MAFSSSTIRMATFAFLGLAVCAWLISLAGVSAVTKVLGSGDPVGFFWWILFANLFTYVLVGASAAMGYHGGRPAVLAILAVVTALTMYLTDVAQQSRRGQYYKSRYDCLFAGFLLMSMLDTILILVFGHDDVAEQVAATTHTAHTTAAPTHPGMAKPAAAHPTPMAV